MAGRTKALLASGFQKLSGWAARVAARLRPALTPDAAYKARLERWKQLWFIADVPLFVDDVAVKRLYDALVRPTFDVTGRTQSQSTSETVEYAIESELKLESDVAPFLKGAASVKSSFKRIRNWVFGVSYTEEANRSTEMRIEQIVDWYVRRFPRHLLWTTAELSTLEDLSGNKVEWATLAKRLEEPAPRPLIVLDLKPQSRLIPMAVELTNAKVKKLYEDLEKKLSDTGLPSYADSAKTPGGTATYWSTLNNAFDATKVLEIVEEATTTEGVRIDWIDFRLIAERPGGNIIPLHLHVMPRGQYATGTFAYQAIRRCFKYGMRIVGTLKQGEDINVIAMYEN